MNKANSYLRISATSVAFMLVGLLMTSFSCAEGAAASTALVNQATKQNLI